MLPARTPAFRHVTATTDEDLLPRTREGTKPLVNLPLQQPGRHVFGLERDAKRIELRALKFNRYLKHEGLTQVLAERKQACERLRRGRERYSRYLKAFMQVGDAADGVSMRSLGHRVELLPDSDLAALRAGDRLSVRLVFEGKPVAGAKIEAFVKDAHDGVVEGQAAVSDADGRVTFIIARPGMWLVRTVHMRLCTGCGDVDWESFWTSYEFAVR